MMRQTGYTRIGLFLLVALVAAISAPLLHLGHAADASASAAAPSARRPNVVILVQSDKQLPVVLQTAAEMRAGKGFPAEKAEVIVCGEAVTALTKDAPMAVAIQKARAQGVRIVACGISLDKKKIPAGNLNPDVETVKNGLIELLQLQSQGYMSVEL